VNWIEFLLALLTGFILYRIAYMQGLKRAKGIACQAIKEALKKEPTK